MHTHFKSIVKNESVATNSGHLLEREFVSKSECNSSTNTLQVAQQSSTFSTLNMLEKQVDGVIGPLVVGIINGLSPLKPHVNN
jgi:hypothetical protein